MAQNAADPVLMQVGSSDVSVSEFRYIYEKNNGEQASYSMKSLQDYLDLYIKFKLKVEKAKSLRLDTISELRSELAGYRKQLAGSYLMDKEVTEALLKELYARIKEDVEFSHIFMPVPANPTQKQKDSVRLEMLAVKAKLVGGMSFEDAVTQFSQDKNSKSQYGRMGYFTAKMPEGFYTFESALYQTGVGQVSDIVESKIGYHIIKVTDKRPARGQIQVAHLLLKGDSKEINTRIDSLYMALQQGADFAQLVAQYSQDKNSSRNEGLLPAFGINVYDKAFEDAAFSITADGAYAVPVRTKAGWHIIRRINKPEMDAYELFVKKMKGQLSKDERFELAKKKLITSIKVNHQFKENVTLLNKFSADQTEEFYSYKWVPVIREGQNTLCSFGTGLVASLDDFAAYCKKNTRIRLRYDKNKPVAETINELYNEFVNEKAIEFEEKNLDTKYPDFKSLMKEYEEGILLFEVTKTAVWDKANQDTVGLKAYYEQNRKKYEEDEKALIQKFTIQTTDKKLADKIYKFAKNNPVDKLQEKFKNKAVVVVMTETVERTSELLKGVKWETGAYSQPLLNDYAKHYSFLKIQEIQAAKVKTLQDARGYVVADFQDFLEKQWVESLRKEFPVNINQQVLQQLIK